MDLSFISSNIGLFASYSKYWISLLRAFLIENSQMVSKLIVVKLAIDRHLEMLSIFFFIPNFLLKILSCFKLSLRRKIYYMETTSIFLSICLLAK